MSTEEGLISLIGELIHKEEIKEGISDELFEKFTEVLQSTDGQLGPSSVLDRKLDKLFAGVSKSLHGSKLVNTNTNKINILLLLITHKLAKALVPKAIKYWPMLYDFTPSTSVEYVVKVLLEDSISNSNSSWLSAILLVRAYASSNIKIRQNIIPKDFHKHLRCLIESSRDFTSAMFLLELIQYIPRFTVTSEYKDRIHSIAIYQKPSWLREIPQGKAGSIELLNYMNKINGNFKGLFQLFSIYFPSNSVIKTYDNGDLILLQIINKVMIIWSPNESLFVPCFLNLNDLQTFLVSEENRIKILFSRDAEIISTSTLITKRSNPETSIEIVLRRQEMVSSFIQILQSATICNSKISVASMSVCGISQQDEKSQNSSVNPSLKTKLRSYNREQVPMIPPPKFFGDSSVSLENSKPSKCITHSKNSNQSKKLRRSKESTSCSSQLDNSIPTPSKLLNDFQKVSKRYGKKPTRQSHKRDIWDFSSSIPTSPQKVQNGIASPETSGNKMEFVPLSESVVSDSQASPSILLPTTNKYIDNVKNNTFQKLSNKLFAAKSSASTHKSEIKISNTPIILPLSNYTSSDILTNDLLVVTFPKKSNITQVHDSLAEVTSKQCSSNSIIPQNRPIHTNSYIDQSTDQSRVEGAINSSPASLSEADGTLSSNAIGSINRNDSKPDAFENRRDSSILENTTAKTSFLDYNTKEYDINKQYSLIYEGLNSLSSNLITRIQKFENEIFLKQKELHDELENNFKLIARNHCENLKKFNSYVAKKSDELFRNLTE